MASSLLPISMSPTPLTVILHDDVQMPLLVVPPLIEVFIRRRIFVDQAASGGGQGDKDGGGCQCDTLHVGHSIK
jgi:hypothetical protein